MKVQINIFSNNEQHYATWRRSKKLIKQKSFVTLQLFLMLPVPIKYLNKLEAMCGRQLLLTCMIKYWLLVISN